MKTLNTPTPGPALAAEQAKRLAVRMVLHGHPQAHRARAVYRAAYARYQASEWGRWERERLEEGMREG